MTKLNTLEVQADMEGTLKKRKQMFASWNGQGKKGRNRRKGKIFASGYTRLDELWDFKPGQTPLGRGGLFRVPRAGHQGRIREKSAD